MPDKPRTEPGVDPGAYRAVALSTPETGEEEWLALREPLESGWLTQGPKVAQFEAAFAERHQAKHAVATTSGTTALHLAMLVLGIGPGDEVIVPALTWVATANVVVYTGAKPVFVDVDPQTYNLDVEQLGQSLTARTRAVIAVHLFGLCANLDALKAVLPNSVAIVEDAACAAVAAYNGKPPGALGLLACFSFHPRKSITTGEGGMLTTDDPQLAELARAYRNHGAMASREILQLGPAPHRLPAIDLLGFNYRMSDLQAAIGLVQLGKLDRYIDERSRWADWYSQKLSAIPWLNVPQSPAGYRHAWQAYVTMVNEDLAPASRNAIMEILQAHGIGTRPGTHAVTDLGYYRQQHGTKNSHCPVATRIEQKSMALPLHNRMTREDFEHVVRILRGV